MAGGGTKQYLLDLLARIRPEQVFLLFGSLFGLIFVFFTPPYQVADEPKHFFRAYQVSERRWRAERQGDRVGGTLPLSLVATAPAVEPVADVRSDPQGLRKKLAEPLAPTSPRVFTPFPNTATYSPIPYLPQAAGILTGRLFGGNIWVQLYAGRLANLGLWLLLSWLALRLVTIRRWTVMFLFLLPMSIYQAASLSADVLTNAITWVAIALTLQTALSAQPLTRKRLWLLVLVYALVALTKPVYVLSALSLFIIPVRVAGSRARWWKMASLIGGTMLVAVAAWYFIGRETFAPLQPDANPGRQLALVLHQPALFLDYIQRTLAVLTRDWIVTTIGFFGWLRLGFPWWYHIWVLLTLGLVAFIERRHTDVLTWSQRGVLLLTFAASLAVIVLSQFIMWGTTDMLTIEGVQGRYFLPVLPLLAWWLPPGDRRPTGNWFFLTMAFVWFFVLVVAIVNAWIGFYPW